MFLDKITKEELRKYLKKCSKFVDMNLEEAYTLSLDAVKFYKGNKVDREKLRLFKSLENEWYESLDNNSPNYSLYNDKTYLFDLWACWVVYSRKYLRELLNEKSLETHSIKKDMGTVNSVVDLGNGCGQTTGALKELFPDAEVYGTNFEDSYQYEIATDYGKEYGFDMIPEVSVLNKDIDLVFASEYFEHMERPIEHLMDVINSCNPKYLIIANAFNSISLGHFNVYKHHTQTFEAKKMGRMFNDTLRKCGYIKVQTKLWNGRPAYWKKDISLTSLTDEYWEGV